MKYRSDSEAWNDCDPRHLWIFDKLLLSKFLGYTCGPVGVNVLSSGTYIVRPCMNLLGMGLGAKFVDLIDSTDHLPPGYFWCEIFNGPHISVDYYKGRQILAVEGKRDPKSPLWKFSKWTKLESVEIQFPESLKFLFQHFEYINAEYIGGNLIELHFRTNPDFEYKNSEAIPVWDKDEINIPEGYTYVENPDYKRKGFYIK